MKNQFIRIYFLVLILGSSESFVLLFVDCRKRRRRASGLVVSKKKRKLLPFIPTKDCTRRMEQMASLATALMATGTEFSNELTYIPGMAPRWANCAALERGGMQVNFQQWFFQHK